MQGNERGGSYKSSVTLQVLRVSTTAFDRHESLSLTPSSFATKSPW